MFLMLQGLGLFNLYSQENQNRQDITPASPSSASSEFDAENNPLTSSVSKISEELPPSYVIEIEAGINFFGYNTNDTIARYNLDNISDQTALSYNFKAGVVFLDHWKSLLIFGYAKRPNFEYPLHHIRSNQSILENHRYFRFGFEQQYLIARYTQRLNLGVGLENSWLQRSVRITERTVVDGSTTDRSAPRTFTWNEYLLSPKIKLFYRISRNSMLHFSVEYHTLFPSLEHYPQLFFGIDISFFLYKPPEEPTPNLEDALQEIPENIQEEAEKTIEESF